MKYYYIETKTKKGSAILQWGKGTKKRWKISSWFAAFRLLNGLRRKNPHFAYRMVCVRKGRFNKVKTSK